MTETTIPGWKSRLKDSLVWILTCLWLAGCAVAISVWSQPYDRNGVMTISDFGDLGSLVAAVVAPIAVFWIIRSFYVQRAELTAAVKAAAEQASAATAQAKSLSQQILLLETQYQASQLSAFNVIHTKSVQSTSTTFLEEKHLFKVSNTGQATASVARLYMSGKKADSGYWLDDSGIAMSIRRDEVFEFEWLVKMGPTQSTVMLLIEIRYRSAAGKELVDYYSIPSHSYGRESVGRQLDRDTYEEMMREAGMAIPTS